MRTQGWLRLGPELLHFFSFFLFCKREVATRSPWALSLCPPHHGAALPPCPLTHLRHAQDHQELPEDIDKVKEEINAVPEGEREGGRDGEGEG